MSHLKQIAQVQTFEELFTLVERIIEPIPGVGELYVYDTSLRIGAKLNLFPEQVYLHAGTRVGARSLGFHGNLRVIDVTKLPAELQRLEPHEIEDVLCIFKDRLKREEIGPNRLDFQKRSWCG
ncbi:MAG: hypothetical protein HY649_09485 [Acidobacteria bacterium]|nr:hypothetical protein [Acidobacteriota bacterium]